MGCCDHCVRDCAWTCVTTRYWGSLWMCVVLRRLCAPWCRHGVLFGPVYPGASRCPAGCNPVIAFCRPR